MSFPKSGNTQENELEQILIEIEQSLTKLQERHSQVKQDLQKRSQLKQRQQQQKDPSLPPPLKTELRNLKQELDSLEFNLESVLLPDIFWQVVRFVFLGIVIGWFLRIWAN